MINSGLLYKYDYSIMWKDLELVRFNPYRHKAELLNPDYLFYNINKFNVPYEIVLSFCADRIMMLNRVHCKEILTSCCIDDQSPLGICLLSKALSFRDNYWIKKCRDSTSWGSVNLYNNLFSEKVARVAITGEQDTIQIGDDLFTGELTSKGTRAKCFIRKNNGIYLYKNENADEINSEMVSHYIASALDLPSVKYYSDTLYGKYCSACQVLTGEDVELILYRDFINYFDDPYNTLMNIDAVNFIKMQVFDYITLNTDRNRDNYGVLRYKGKFHSLYPIYDHDSCFKGRGTNGVYFPTGQTFARTLNYLKSLGIYRSIINMEMIYSNLSRIGDMITEYKGIDAYNGMMKRVLNL